MLTGTTTNRADYQQMLADAEAGHFSNLGLYRADRFGRNAVEGLQAATKLISLGIKLRVASMPSLEPETPDGFFMFLIQMGLAQREVDVLRQRTADGMEAKMRAGGWPQRAPDGYVNKERQIGSNKYERWVEIDPEFSPVIRQAWDFLLTGRYTLKQICEELSRLGFTRASGRPWAWNTPKIGKRVFADNRLHNIFHNPFYAGWGTSERFGIKMGEIRGKWDPIITTKEYERGLAILRKHDAQKSRNKKHFYLLRGLLWVEENDKCIKMYVSTPSGRSRGYSYYMTRAKINGMKIHIPCKVVDAQIPDWLDNVSVHPELIPVIQKVYQSELKKNTHEDRGKKIAKLKRQLSQLGDEEARLGRLLITSRISDETYDQLRKEWQEKVRNFEISIAELERDTVLHLDDLDIALVLLTRLSLLYDRLSEKDRANQLQILVKRIIVNAQGKIVDHELNTPFVYLRNLVDYFYKFNPKTRGSTQVRLGAHAIKEVTYR